MLPLTECTPFRQALLRAYPLLLGCNAADASTMVACLVDAGLTSGELERMLLGWPQVLLKECAPALPRIRRLRVACAERV